MRRNTKWLAASFAISFTACLAPLFDGTTPDSGVDGGGVDGGGGGNTNVDGGQSGTGGDGGISPYSDAGHGWQVVLEVPFDEYLSAVWGTGPADLWVGGDRVLYHWNGAHWQRTELGALESISSIWGTAAGDVWAVGESGNAPLILHFNGASWSPVSISGPRLLRKVWGLSANDVWAAGVGGVLHFDGNSWSNVVALTAANYGDVWGTSPDNVYAVSSDGGVQFNGTSWSSFTAKPILAIWGSSSSDVWAAQGGYAPLRHFDGVTWSSTIHEVGYFKLVGGSAANDVWAAGGDGTVIHYNGGQWQSQPAVGGDIAAFWVAGHNDLYILQSHKLLHGP